MVQAIFSINPDRMSQITLVFTVVLDELLVILNPKVNDEPPYLYRSGVYVCREQDQ